MLVASDEATAGSVMAKHDLQDKPNITYTKEGEGKRMIAKKGGGGVFKRGEGEENDSKERGGGVKNTAVSYWR